MGMFSPERIKNLALSKGLYGHDGKLKKVYSAARGRWILLEMFCNRGKKILEGMFPK